MNDFGTGRSACFKVESSFNSPEHSGGKQVKIATVFTLGAAIGAAMSWQTVSSAGFVGMATKSLVAPKNSNRENVQKVQQSAQQAIQFRVINRTNGPVDVYVVNPQTNQPQLINGTLQPGQTRDLSSQPGLVWVFGQNRQEIQRFQTQQALFQQIEITPSGQQRQPVFANQYRQSPGQQGQQQVGQQNQQGQLQVGQQPLNNYNQGGQRQQQTANLGGYNQQGNQVNVPTQPPGFWSSTITPSFCSRARLAPGIAADTCRYLSHLQGTNPGLLAQYMQGVQARLAAAQQGNGQNNQYGAIPQQNSGQNQQPLQPTRPKQPPAIPVSQYQAQSWGGIVRSGPSMESQRVASLGEGEQITLLEDSGVWMNDYKWFRIQYHGGQTGYQWGGIICGVGQEIPGAYKTCNQ